jgi:hypothetical protein
MAGECAEAGLEPSTLPHLAFFALPFKWLAAAL